MAAKTIGTLMGLNDDLTKVLTGWAEYTARALDPGDPQSWRQGSPQDMRQNLRCFKAITSFYDAREAGEPGYSGSSLVNGSSASALASPRDELVLSVLQLFQAGYETMVPAICHLLATFLADRPDPIPPGMPAEALAAVIDEGVRLASPVRATVRVATADRSISGVEVPAGAPLLVLIGAANRDEQFFPSPGEFRPGQRPPHLAFGAGAHRCLGRFLAQLELRQVMGCLMAAAGRMELDGAPQQTANFLKAGYASLPLKIEWRSPRTGL